MKKILLLLTAFNCNAEIIYTEDDVVIISGASNYSVDSNGDISVTPSEDSFTMVYDDDITVMYSDDHGTLVYED